MSVLMHCQKYSMLLISRYCFCLAYCADWKNWQQVPHSGPCHTSSRQGLYLAASCLYRKLAFIDIAILCPLFSVFPFLLWNSLWLVEQVLNLLCLFLIVKMEISRFLWEIFIDIAICCNMAESTSYLHHASSLFQRKQMHPVLQNSCQGHRCWPFIHTQLHCTRHLL